MAATKILARDFDFHLNTGTVSVPVWTEINGVQSWSHSPTGNDANTTTFDEDGRLSHLKASRGDAFTLDGLYITDVDTGTRDAGQAAVSVWADAIGPDSLKQFRITNPDGNTLTFMASATTTQGSGGTDDPAAFSIAITASGAVTNSAVVAVPGDPTSVTGTALTDAATVTWTDGSGTATSYQVRAFDDADDSIVATITTDTKPAYFAGLTTGDDIYFQVRALNASGWSGWSASSTVIEIL